MKQVLFDILMKS